MVANVDLKKELEDHQMKNLQIFVELRSDMSSVKNTLGTLKARLDDMDNNMESNLGMALAKLFTEREFHTNRPGKVSPFMG